MTEFVLTINGKDGKSYKKEVNGSEADILLNKKLNEEVKGDTLGLKGYVLVIKGGSDKNGFPIRKDVEPGTRKRPLVVSGVGAKFKKKGLKQRKTVRGNLIDDNIKQINLKVQKEGVEKLEKLFGSTEGEKPTEDLTDSKPKIEEEVAKENKQVKETTEENNKDEGKGSEESKK